MKLDVAIRQLSAVLLVSVSVLYSGCTTLPKQTGETQKIPQFANSFQLCLPTVYAPDVAKLVPECRPYPPGSKVYQLTTTVWVRRNAIGRSGMPN
jgi:hypothetical protein